MFVHTTTRAVLDELGEPELICDDQVVPASVEVLDTNPYRPEYGWLHSYERNLARVLDRWLPERRFELFGGQGVLTEALSNAFCHGHRRQRQLAIRVSVWAGRSGLLVQIRDQGPGFAVEPVLAQVESGKRGYFSNAGNGLRRMCVTEWFGVFFEDGGRAFNLVCWFGDSERAARPDRSSGFRLGRKPP